MRISEVETREHKDLAILPLLSSAGLVGWTRVLRVTHAFPGLSKDPPPQNGAPFMSFSPSWSELHKQKIVYGQPTDGKFGTIFEKLLPSYILTSGSLNQPKMLSKNWIKSIITNVCPIIWWAFQMSGLRPSAVRLWAHTPQHAQHRGQQTDRVELAGSEQFLLRHEAGKEKNKQEGSLWGRLFLSI